MTLHFIELTSYLEPPDGFPTAPYFDSDLWPLLLRHATEVSRVLLFAHASARIPLKCLSKYERVGANIASLGSLAELSQQMLKEIWHWSFYGGHLSCLFEASSKSSLLPQLLQLYPTPGKMGTEDTDELGLDTDARFELKQFMRSVNTNDVIASFAHDGDPLYIFSDPKTLKSLLRLT